MKPESDKAVKRSVSMPASMLERLEALSGPKNTSRHIQMALEKYLSGVTETDQAISALSMRVAELEKRARSQGE